jgi:hypothetical protein
VTAAAWTAATVFGLKWEPFGDVPAVKDTAVMLADHTASQYAFAGVVVTWQGKCFSCKGQFGALLCPSLSANDVACDRGACKLLGSVSTLRV